MTVSKSDTINVVGAGCCGLSTTLSLLEQGFTDVHLFDKRDYLAKGYDYFKECDSPSSDMNKIFRSSYGEETWYQKMSKTSMAVLLKWNQMIKEEGFEGGEPVFFNTGNVHLTDQDELPVFEAATIKWMGKDRAIRVSEPDAEARALKAGVDACAVDPFQMKERNAHLEGVLDTTGGTILADKACRWVLHLCLVNGQGRLTVHLGPGVGEVDHLVKSAGECTGIVTKDGATHSARLTVCTCGPWLTAVVPETQERLEATGGTVALMKVTDPKALAKYDESKFPTWTYKMRDGAMGGLYGFPIRNGYMKIGFRGLKWINPQPGMNSKIKTKWSAPETETNVPLYGLLQIKRFIRDNIPEVGRISLTRLCWYGDSEDNDYLIDYSPYHKNDSLLVVGGDSGHAFMMIGAIGNIITDIMQKRGDSFLAKLFSWARIRTKKNVINQGLSDPRALQNQKMASEKDWVIYRSKL